MGKCKLETSSRDITADYEEKAFAFVQYVNSGIYSSLIRVGEQKEKWLSHRSSIRPSFLPKERLALYADQRKKERIPISTFLPRPHLSRQVPSIHLFN